MLKTADEIIQSIGTDTFNKQAINATNAPITNQTLTNDTVSISTTIHATITPDHTTKLSI